MGGKGARLYWRVQWRRNDGLGALFLVLVLGLPELIGPPEGIVDTEGFRREGGEQLSQLHLVIESDGEIQHGIVPPEDAGESEAGKAAGEIEAIPGFEFRGKFLTFLQRDRDEAIGLVGDEEVVLGEEAGEEQAVPVLVGGEFAQVIDVLAPRACVASIAPENPKTRPASAAPSSPRPSRFPRARAPSAATSRWRRSDHAWARSPTR